MRANVYSLKKFSNTDNYNAYEQSDDFKRPNISIDGTTVHLSTPENNKIDISISDEQNLNNYTKAPCSLKKFETLTEYTNYINGQSGSVKKPNISYCIENERVYWNLANNNQFDLPLEPPTPEIGDILYSDNTTHKLSFTSEVLDTSEGKTPIAICVAPRRFFGYNEKARWMSLKYMSLRTPDTGDIGWDAYTQINYGNYGVDIPMISNISTIYIINGTFDHGGYNQPYAYLSTDWSSYSDGTNVIPSVFDTNNNWNINELGGGINGIGQYAMTDIDGFGYTKSMINTVTEQTTWRTDTTIENNPGEGYAPAACCCQRYCPQGTQPGDWYLPACGELAMMITLRSLLADKMTALNTKYMNDCINFFDDFDYLRGDTIKTWPTSTYIDQTKFLTSSESAPRYPESPGRTWCIRGDGLVSSQTTRPNPDSVTDPVHNGATQQVVAFLQY